MSNFVNNILIKLSCIIFILIASIFYINILVSVAAATSIESRIDCAVLTATELDTLALIVEPENAETIATSDIVMWMTGLIEVDLDTIVGTPQSLYTTTYNV